MISDIDLKLANKNGIFNEDEHNLKRQILLQRAADAKKRIEAQNKLEGLSKKPAYEMIEDCK